MRARAEFLNLRSAVSFSTDRNRKHVVHSNDTRPSVHDLVHNYSSNSAIILSPAGLSEVLCRHADKCKLASISVNKFMTNACGRGSSNKF